MESFFKKKHDVDDSSKKHYTYNPTSNNADESIQNYTNNFNGVINQSEYSQRAGASP